MEHMRTIVGCDGVVYVRRTGVLLDTREDRQRELFVNEGGNTGLIPRPFTGRGFFNFMVTIQAYAKMIRFRIVPFQKRRPKYDFI